jgi:hypothetical protein
MTWHLRVAAAVLPAVMASGFATTTASADPVNEPDSTPSCTYTLTPPHLAAVSGVTMVTASLTPFPCTGAINPNSMSVCLKRVGDPSSGECGREARPIAAHVFMPYRPGASYEATGRGCGSIATAEGITCSTQGPYAATL